MGADITEWDVEDETFWETTGKKIAYRTLWVSIPCLLLAFAVWGYWSVITVQMTNLGFPFKEKQMLTIAAIAGITGATFRIPSAFLVRMAGGRNVIAFTTALLIIPAALTGIALSNNDTPLWVFQVCAFLSGIGGGNFASSMANINFFFPRAKKGTALGLNAGLGNAGVTTMQILIPLVMTVGIFGGASLVLQKNSGTLIGTIQKGTETWIQNGAYVWIVFLVPLTILAWVVIRNIRTDYVTANPGPPVLAFAKIGGMLGLSAIPAAIGVWIYLPSSVHGSLPGLGAPSWAKYPMVVGVVAATVGLLKLVPGGVRVNLNRQYKIFANKHTWVMTVIYTMTFGSFIGFSFAFGILMQTEFPKGPAPFTLVWLGPFIGAFIRPVGGWLADKLGGAIITMGVAIVMTLAALGVAWTLEQASEAKRAEDWFPLFFVLFMVLFAATGIGNGSTFRTIAAVFPSEQAAPALGWTSAIAAYGAFLVPLEFGEQIKAGTPQTALYIFAAFYVVCAVLNYWYYLGPKAEFKNP